ncbi:metallophosphoesterase [Pseudomonas sp. RIT-PI-S]|uniref:metallophosphoesterase n=1 Tax=Pseudomonas sp. RIT-PI-S TaxID=3035295 RepID=UPI0021DAA9B4|nr:metallophosphoesterase [Pseudomonas sp. RIT-PI-S]
MAAVLSFGINRDGRDFVVGDVHGCFDRLQALLAKVGFDYGHDRLFCVGDLIDHGPLSHEVLDWLGEPWMFSVRGNHEQQLVEAFTRNEADWGLLSEHFAWLLGRPVHQQFEFALQLAALPLAIEISTAAGVAAIVHSGCVGGDWWTFREALRRGDAAAVRSALYQRAPQRAASVAGLQALLVGHTPVKRVRHLGNIWYLDTAAAKGGQLSAACLADGSVHSVPGRH